ncbi:MAG: class I SAM-dependent methyltransferase, partial [Polyangiaceae bacterium]|nr:class I SAM-dependent methyltransferase [Polyangiaceae bacterium]
MPSPHIMACTLPPVALPAGAVLLDDGAWIVVNKPADVSVDGSSAGDDLVGRLKRVLSARDSVPPSSVYLRAHQHLERDTSGIVALARCPEANCALAAAAAQHRGQVTVLLGGEAGPRLRAEGAFDAHVRRQPDGSVCTRRSKQGSWTERVHGTYRVTERRDTRALVEVVSQQTSVRNLRAVLVSEGLLVPAGDAAHGGEPAPRLLVHVLRARMDHPLRAVTVEVATPAPWVFPAWLHDELCVDKLPEHVVPTAIADALIRRDVLLRRGDLDAVRLVHGEAEGLWGLDIEAYGPYLVVWLGEQVPEAVRERVLDSAHALGARGVYSKIRPKQASRMVDARTKQLTAPHAARGQDAEQTLHVQEGPLRFAVRMGEGLSTGLFLDQRRTRAWVRDHAKDMRVLNLFAHTCSFTVAAAAAGARCTVSVDASARLLEQGRANLERNGLMDARQELVCADVLAWLRDAAGAGREFDLIILDPPSYSTTRQSRFSAARDYVALAASCMDRIGAGGGTLLACTNHRGV